LRQHYEAFQQAGAEILGISSEDQKRGARFKTEFDLPFRLLADPERRVIQAYGVFHQNEPKGRPISRPAVFVLDPAGILRYRYVGAQARDRPSTETILAAVRDARNTGQGSDRSIPANR